MNRRDILRRTAAAGLLATPAAGLLSGCATGGGGDKNDAETYQGTKSAQNPLGVKEDAPLEVVIFNGGFGEEYAKAHEAMYTEKYPKAKIKHSATQEISKTLQPRFVDGTPPDVVNNSGAGQIDFNGLVAQNALADLGELLDAPSLDIPGKTVRDTLLPGAVEVGSYDGKFLVLNYTYTVYGIWHSDQALRRPGLGVRRRPGTSTSRSASRSRPPASRPGRTPGKHPRYMSWPLISTAIKFGGPSVADRHRQPGAERLEVRRDEGRRRRLAPDRQGQVHPGGLARPGPHPVADRLVPGQGRLHLLRLLAGERAEGRHPGRVQHDHRADAEPGQRRQAAVRGDPGHRRRAVHRARPRPRTSPAAWSTSGPCSRRRAPRTSPRRSPASPWSPAPPRASSCRTG